MPRRLRRLGAPTLAVLIVTALLAMVSFVPGAAGAATTTPTASPTPTPSGSPTGSSPAKPPTVTFGIGPSNGKQLDGRSYFSYAASPGSVINDHFALINISNQTLDLLVYGTSAVTDASGGLAYEPDGSKRTGTGAWLRTPLLNGQPLFPIKGRSTVVLPFQITVPANASPGDHTAGIAVGLIANVVGKSTKNFKFEQRVVAKVYVRVSGTPLPQLEVTNVHASYAGTLNPLGGGDAKVTYTVKNTGNVDLGAKQSVSISGLFGGVGSPTTKVPELPDLLPGSTTTLTVRFHDVLPEVLLNASVKLTPIALPGSVDGALHGASGSGHFFAIPWAFLVLVLLLVAAVYAVRRYRRHLKDSRTAPSHRRTRGTDRAPALASESEK